MLSLTMAWALSGLLGDKTLGTSLWIWGLQREKKPEKTEKGLREGRDPSGDVAQLGTADSAPL